MQVEPDWTLRPADAGDRPAVLALLRQAGLPLAGLDDPGVRLWVAERDGRVAGVIGLERYQRFGLLRSAAVAPGERGRGLGTRLTDHVLALARGEGINVVYLLTMTAAPFFERFGFRPLARLEIPAAVQASAELSGACPASTIAMGLALD